MLDFSESNQDQDETPENLKNKPDFVPDLLHNHLTEKFGDIEYKLNDELPEHGIRFFHIWNRESKEFENWNLDMVVMSYQKQATVYRILDNNTGEYLC